VIPEEKYNIFGTKFSCVVKNKIFSELSELKIKGPGYINFPSTDIVAKAYKSKKLRSILNNSLITFTDGKFTEFYARFKGENRITNISGYDLLEYLLGTEKSHFFYGLNEEQLSLLEKKINKQNPNSKVLGYKSPPFLKLDEIESDKQIEHDIREINRLKPDFIWVGISSPKQDYLMSQYANQLDQGIMIGVGAVLLYKAGIVKKGPQWIKNIGMRWLIRFIQEPKRVWKKGSIKNIMIFLYLILKHDILRFELNLSD